MPGPPVRPSRHDPRNSSGWRRRAAPEHADRHQTHKYACTQNNAPRHRCSSSNIGDGWLFDQKLARELSRLPRLIMVCGKYEGVDARVRILAVDEEISIGDYILTGGELAAMVIMEATARLLPGVLGDEASTQEESFTEGLLEYPHYTRPRELMACRVPDVLLSGNHQQIAAWRRRKAIEGTFEKRPDLLGSANLTEEEREYLERVGNGVERTS